MYKAVIIGAGRIGVEFDQCHAQAFKDCKDTELVGIIDIDIEKAKRAAKKWDIPLVSSGLGLGNAVGYADIYSICTPPETHLNVLGDVLFYNPKAILCEKPIATTLEDADKMIRLCKLQGIILQVNHQRRWGMPTFRYSRGILNTMTHGFDLLRMYFGEVDRIEKDIVYFKSGMKVRIENVPVQEETIFEFKTDTTGTFLKGVEHLVECIKEGKQSISSGESAREDLRLCLELMNGERK